MSQNFLNNLPTELLLLVFDYLSVRQQLVVKLVCVRWLEILERKRYLARYGIRLDPKEVDCETYLELLKKYPVYKVKDLESASHFQKIQQLLHENGLSETVEDLSIHLVKHSWMDLLMQNNKIQLPKLKVLRLSYPKSESFPKIRHPNQLILPSLKSIKTDNIPISHINELLESCCNQIGSLCISFQNQAELRLMFERYSFSNLSILYLRLDFVTNVRMDLKSIQKGTFGKLKTFSISCTQYDSTLGLESLIAAATNLEKLFISGGVSANRCKSFHSNLSVPMFNVINNLKKLRLLSLIAELPGPGSADTLSLPALQQLTMVGTKPIRLEFAPGLKSLSLRGVRRRIDLDNLVTVFSVCNHQLEKLKIVFSPIDLAVCEQLCGLSNLKQLQLNLVVMESSHPQMILSTLEQLHRFEMQCSILVDQIIDDGDEKVRPSGEIPPDELKSRWLRAEDIFKRLKVEYSRCIVLNTNNFHVAILHRCQLEKEMQAIISNIFQLKASAARAEAST